MDSWACLSICEPGCPLIQQEHQLGTAGRAWGGRGRRAWGGTVEGSSLSQPWWWEMWSGALTAKGRVTAGAGTEVAGQ